MKKASDPRHLKRIRLMQDLFAWNFNNKEKISAEGKEIVKKLPKIDKEIAKAAPEWPIAKINQIDLAILRLAIFELIMKKEQPFKVIVDEAVELAKKFGAQSSSGFINGALGKIITAHKLDQ